MPAPGTMYQTKCALGAWLTICWYHTLIGEMKLSGGGSHQPVRGRQFLPFTLWQGARMRTLYPRIFFICAIWALSGLFVQVCCAILHTLVVWPLECILFNYKLLLWWIWTLMSEQVNDLIWAECLLLQYFLPPKVCVCFL